MKNLIMGILLICGNIVFAQEVKKKTTIIGLKVATGGVAISLIGVSMKTNATPYFNGRFGYNHMKRESTLSRLRTQKNTLLTGSMLIISGLIVQNIKLKKLKINKNVRD